MATAVEVVSSELVAPSEPTPRRALWLSNLDLAAWNGYTPTVYFFPRPQQPTPPPASSSSSSADVERLRAALARALVRFYPLAGRLVHAGRARRHEVDCDAAGALFVVARSAAALEDKDLEGFAPSEAMKDVYVPKYDSAGGPDAPLLLIQVTFFRCGGVALGTAMHHFVVDGRSAFHFMQTWASIARGGDVVPPSLDRTPLRARPLRTVLFDHSHEYGGWASSAAAAAAATTTGGKPAYASAILRVSGAQVAGLRARTGAAASTFRALGAHVWRCACAARALAPDSQSRLFTMVDVRGRLSPPLPGTFFGNAVVRTSVSARVGDLLTNPPEFGARLLREATGHGDEYARSLVDYLETAEDLAAKPRGGLGLRGTDLIVTSWLGLPSYDADFGWGEPALLAPALMNYSALMYVMSCPGSRVAMSPWPRRWNPRACRASRSSSSRRWP